MCYAPVAWFLLSNIFCRAETITRKTEHLATTIIILIINHFSHYHLGLWEITRHFHIF